MNATHWRVGGNVIDLTTRALLMGVLNVTPDSFSDGGEFFATEAAVKHGVEMARSGAEIIDIGGESTRPGAMPISPNEEMRRVVPVIEQIAPAISAQISIDTSKPEVARAAIEAGASIINDVTGGRGDPGMFALAAEKRVALIIVHMQGTPQTMQLNPTYRDVLGEVADFFRQQFAEAVRSGVDPMCIAFDPGIGFGKTVAHNLELLANLPRIQVESRPMVVGVSRKSFLGKISDLPADRASATVALTSLLRARGAHVLRVHDVLPNASALRATEAVLAATR
jgi:dihydropteroate synthase